MYCAARELSVPESTLRDRTRGNVMLDTRVGIIPFHNFSVSEAKQLLDHIGLDKRGYQVHVNIFLISRRQHMLLVFIRSASARCF